MAYRILGSLTDADDVVQDAWLRLVRADPDEIEELRAWLTVVVGRLCLDHLRSARVRRESYVGPWLPEPVVGVAGAESDIDGLAEPIGGGPTPVAAADPADRVTLAESVSMAVLVVLETLSPPERTAFVLHDVFGSASARSPR